MCRQAFGVMFGSESEATGYSQAASSMPGDSVAPPLKLSDSMCGHAGRVLYIKALSVPN